MEVFLNHFDFSQDKSLEFARSYIEATRLLYGNGQGEVWFSKGDGFAKGVSNKDKDKDQGSNHAISSIHAEYATLLDTKANKTNDKNDRDAAIGAFDKP